MYKMALQLSNVDKVGTQIPDSRKTPVTKVPRWMGNKVDVLRFAQAIATPRKPHVDAHMGTRYGGNLGAKP